jgi:hypothetical protein
MMEGHDAIELQLREEEEAPHVATDMQRAADHLRFKRVVAGLFETMRRLAALAPTFWRLRTHVDTLQLFELIEPRPGWTVLRIAGVLRGSARDCLARLRPNTLASYEGTEGVIHEVEWRGWRGPYCAVGARAVASLALDGTVSCGGCLADVDESARCDLALYAWGRTRALQDTHWHTLLLAAMLE